jgi:hypothetical protein
MANRVRHAVGVVLLVGCTATLTAQGPPGGRGEGRGAPAPAPAPLTPQQLAPQNLSLTGYWVSVVNEDWRWRMVTPPAGDFVSLPLNPEGQRVGRLWTPAQDGSCLAYGMAGLMRMPIRIHVTWQDAQTLKIETDAGQQTRVLHFDASKAPTTASLQGRSVALWENTSGRGRGGPGGGGPGGPGGGRGGPPPPPAPAQFGTLKVTTDRLTPAWLRRNGVPYSENAVVEEYFDNIDSTNGDKWLIVTTTVKDSKYLNADYITSSHFKREAAAEGPRPKNWLSASCKPA